MAVDQQAILQLLTQLQGGSGGATQPTSGLQDPSLSGLRLGEQGMGLGGGGSILGGGGGGIGGGDGGPGLDLFQLQALLSSPETRAAGGTLGQFPVQFPSFGAGGLLAEPQQGGGVPQSLPGLAGVGGGGLLETLGKFAQLGKPLAEILKRLLPSQAGSQGLPSPNAAGLDTGVFGELGGEAFLGETGISSPLPGFPLEATGTAGPGGTFSAAGNIVPTLGAGIGATAPEAGAISAPFLAGGGPESVGALEGLAGVSQAAPAAAGTGLAVGGPATAGEFLGALSPVSAILGLLSIADLFGAPGLGIGNIFQGQHINDLNAAQTEAAIRQAVALGQQGGPSEVNFQQRGLDAQLIASLFPTLGPVSPRPDDPFQQRLQTVLGTPGATLSLADLQQLSALSPQLQNPSLEPAAFGAQRRFRTLAGFPFVPPPPAIESALDPRAQAFFRDPFIPGDA